MSNEVLINRETILTGGDSFSVVTLPSDTYKVLKILVSGVALNSGRENIGLRFGNLSIDTDSNYWTSMEDDFATTVSAAADNIGLTRTAWAYNNSDLDSILEVTVYGLGENEIHVARTFAQSYYDRYWCYGNGGWSSSDEILRVAVIDVSGSGLKLGSRCTIYGYT